MRKDLLYAISCFAFIIIGGGAVYEHINMVPTWSAAPPISLSMFQGEYGLKGELFWMMIHPVNLVLLILCLIFHWRSERRKSLLIVIGNYVLILVITTVYFVPELMSILNTPFATSTDADLTRRASLWETLSLVRLGILVVLSMILLMGLTKNRSRLGTA